MAETIAPGTTRYLCPLRCGWHHDVPPPSAADMAGIAVPPNVTDLGGAISHLAAETTLRTAAVTEAALAEHIGTHTTVEFVTVIERLHAEIRQLAPAPAPSSTPDKERARRNAILDVAQARADRDAVARVRELAERWENALVPDLPYARSLYAALDGQSPAPALPDPGSSR